MRDKDQIILEKCYSNIKHLDTIILEQEENIYRVELENKDVDINVYTNDDDLHLDSFSKVCLKFKISINKYENQGIDIHINLLEIEPFKIKLVRWTEDDDEEFFFEIPSTNISHINPTFAQSTRETYGQSKSYVQIVPQFLELHIVGVRGTRGLESRKVVSYVVDPSSVEVDFSR